MWISHSVKLPNCIVRKKKEQCGFYVYFGVFKKQQGYYCLCITFWGCRKKNVGVQEETAKNKMVFSHLVWDDTRRYGGVGRKSQRGMVLLRLMQTHNQGPNFYWAILLLFLDWFIGSWDFSLHIHSFFLDFHWTLEM